MQRYRCAASWCFLLGTEASSSEEKKNEKQASSTKPVVVDVEEVGEMEEQQEQQQEQQEQLQTVQHEQEQGLEVKGKWPCPRCTLLNDVGATSCICDDEDGSNAGGPPRRRRTAQTNLLRLLNTVRVAVMVAFLRNRERQSKMRHLYAVLLHLPWRRTPR
jgi:hypothetical protein